MCDIRPVLAILILLSASGCVSSGRGEEPRIERTTNEDIEIAERRLMEGLLRVERVDDSHVALRTSPWLSDSGNESASVLGISDVIYESPDEHGWRQFTLKEITDEGVVFEYESGFSHVSFGVDKISIDTGLVFIPYKTDEDTVEETPTRSGGIIRGGEGRLDRIGTIPT